ncbi:DNA polymerase III subunit delta [Hydrogenimonas urashimensis]|uniref:DNA polymerase III subunit delta n=1 Tax=Hydrogenimonas urashimensis TaxID=2740515 RepID=UPI001914EA7D|nr:DNA polymerase III subunit delta [Hydrogenimonas urashimensis]
MYKREFDQLLASGTIPKSLMLYGENDYYIDAYARRYIALTGAEDGMMKLYFDEYDFQAAKNYLGQSSLFGDLNLLFVKSDRKIPKKELTHLIDLAHRNPNNFFLFAYMGSDFKTMASAFSKKMEAEHVRFFPPNLREAAELLQQRARELDIRIDRYALEHLLMTLNLNLSMAMNELEKLAILEGPVGAKEIDEHVFSLAPMAMDTFLFSLFSRKPLSEIVPQLQQLGEDEFAILRAIQYFTTQLFMFHTYIKLHGAPDSSEILGYRLPKQLETQRAQLAVKIPLPLFEKIFDALAAGEIAIKTAGGSSQKETLLLSILIKIKSFLG